MKDTDFDRIYTIYFPKLVRFAQTYLLYREEAENIVQDIFLQLWESTDRLLLQSSLNAYLFTIVKNRCIDALRKYDQMQDKRFSCPIWNAKSLTSSYILCNVLMTITSHYPK